MPDNHQSEAASGLGTIQSLRLSSMETIEQPFHVRVILAAFAEPCGQL
jgi:hypothetical protein